MSENVISNEYGYAALLLSLCAAVARDEKASELERRDRVGKERAAEKWMTKANIVNFGGLGG